MRINIYGNTGDWDADSMGYLGTVEAVSPEEGLRDFIMRQRSNFLTPEECQFEREDIVVKTDDDELDAYIEDEQINNYYNGRVDCWALVEQKNFDPRLLMAGEATLS